MGNLIRMDLYRMRKEKRFWICLGLAFLLALGQTPLQKLLTVLSGMLDNTIAFPPTAEVSAIIADPFPFLNAMLAMLSACGFFYADIEGGYIKNIAGQMPKRGYTVLSKFIAIIFHNLIFMAIGIMGNLAGTVIFQRLVTDADLMQGVITFLMRFMLIQSICSILLFFTTTLRNKSLGTVAAVLLGTGLMFLAYAAVSSGISELFKLEDFDISKYMPDQLLNEAKPDVLKSVLSSVITTVIFLPLAIHIFDKRDVK